MRVFDAIISVATNPCVHSYPEVTTVKFISPFSSQELLVNLMQSGTLQVHADGESGQQYIALPLSLMQTSNGSGGGNTIATMTTSTTNSTNATRQRTTNGASTSSGGSGDSIMKEVNVKTELNND